MKGCGEVDYRRDGHAFVAALDVGQKLRRYFGAFGELFAGQLLTFAQLAYPSADLDVKLLFLHIFAPSNKFTANNIMKNRYNEYSMVIDKQLL